MRLWQHVVVALLPVVAYSLVRYRRLAGEDVVLVVFLATLFPDAVDKPLAWTFGVLPSGRMVAHSVVIAVPVVLMVLLVASRWGAVPLGVGVAWGYLSHLAGDFYWVLWRGTEYYLFPNLFWPLLEANPSRNPGGGQHALELGHAVAAVAVMGLVVSYVMVAFWR